MKEVRNHKNLASQKISYLPCPEKIRNTFPYVQVKITFDMSMF